MTYGLEFWRTAAIVGMAVGQTLFVVLYCTFPWWKTFLGRALFAKALSLMLLVNAVALARVFNFTGANTYFVLLYVILGVGIWVEFFTFLRVKWDARNDGTDRSET